MYDFTDDDDMDDEASDDEFSSDKEVEEQKDEDWLETRDNWTPENLILEKGNDGMFYLTGSKARIEMMKSDLERAFRDRDIIKVDKDYQNSKIHYDLEGIASKVKEFESEHSVHVDLDLPSVIKVFSIKQDHGNIKDAIWDFMREVW